MNVKIKNTQILCKKQNNNDNDDDDNKIKVKRKKKSKKLEKEFHYLYIQKQFKKEILLFLIMFDNIYSLIKFFFYNLNNFHRPDLT